MYVLILSTNFVWNISHSKKWVRYDHKCTVSLSSRTIYSFLIWTKLGFSRQILKKYLNIFFFFVENPSSGSRVVPCGQTATDRRTYMTKLIVAFHNYANAPKNCDRVVYLPVPYPKVPGSNIDQKKGTLIFLFFSSVHSPNADAGVLSTIRLRLIPFMNKIHMKSFYETKTKKSSSKFTVTYLPSMDHKDTDRSNPSGNYTYHPP